MEPNELSKRDMDEFERKLRRAMQRREAPLGLKARVLARARERRQARHGRAWILQRIGASVVLAAVFGGFAAYRQAEQREEERRKGEEAREQVMLALRITHKTLDRVGEHLAESEK